MKNVKSTLSKMGHNTWGKLGLVVIALALVNVLSAVIFKFNPIVHAYTFVTNVFTEYNKEEQNIEIKSKEYENNVSGHYKMTNHAEWSGENTVKVTSRVQTISKDEENYHDVILMLDTSSVDGKNICTLENKQIIKTFSEDIIKSGGKVAIVTFSEASELVTEFTKNSLDINKAIDEMECHSGIYNSYYKGLKTISSYLEQYKVEENRELTIEIITDGKATKDSPNDEIEYALLKEKIKNLNVNVIQYNDNKKLDGSLSKVSDTVYASGYDELKDTMYKTIENREFYQKFMVGEIVNGEFFTINKDTITISNGTYEITEEEQGEKLEVSIPEYTLRTGNDILITYEVTIKDGMMGVSGYIPITKEILLNAILKDGTEISGNYKETPVLQTGYTLTYNPNYPAGCKKTFEKSGKYYAYETVNISEEQPVCEGYKFNGWEAKEKINYINSKQFFMSNHDTELIGTWSKISITSTLEK